MKKIIALILSLVFICAVTFFTPPIDPANVISDSKYVSYDEDVSSSPSCDATDPINDFA